MRLRGTHTPTEPTPEAMIQAKDFLLAAWRERTLETGRPEPDDLTDSCKFTSLFMAVEFGGSVRGNYFHQFCRLPDGHVFDPNEDACDVRTLLETHQMNKGNGRPHPFAVREVAPLVKSMVRAGMWKFEAEAGVHPYEDDTVFLGCPAHIESMHSVVPRVGRWLEAFRECQLIPKAPKV